MVDVQRTTLFYDQFRLCARFHMPECHALRRLDHRCIDRTIEQRRRWGRRLVHRPVGSWQHAWEPLEITSEMESNLHVLCDFLLLDQTPRRIRIQEDNIFVYCNDQRLFDDIISLGVCNLLEIVQVQQTGTPGKINLRSSDHAFRTYLRARRLAAATAGSVQAFLLAQKDVRLSPSLFSWCANKSFSTRTHFFLDHDSNSTINMLELIAPGLVKSTLPITTDK